MNIINAEQQSQSQQSPTKEQSDKECNNHNCFYGPQIDSQIPITGNTLYFNDGKRSIDFVLVWKKQDENRIASEENRSVKREIFETNLINEGLELEHTIIEDSICFIKVHAPFEVLRRYSEILKLRMPMKEVKYFDLIFLI